MKTKTINDLCLSDHLRQERADRMVEILSTVGIGTVKWIVPSTKNPDVVYRFSTTGIIFVCSKSNDMVMTAYLVNKSKAYAVFNGKPPKELWKKILENEKKGLTHDQGYVIIALERNERRIKMFVKVWYTVKWTYKDEDGNYRTPRHNFNREEDANNKIFELSHTKGVKDIWKTTCEHWKFMG